MWLAKACTEYEETRRQHKPMIYLDVGLTTWRWIAAQLISTHKHRVIPCAQIALAIHALAILKIQRGLSICTNQWVAFAFSSTVMLQWTATIGYFSLILVTSFHFLALQEIGPNQLSCGCEPSRPVWKFEAWKWIEPFCEHKKTSIRNFWRWHYVFELMTHMFVQNAKCAVNYWHSGIRQQHPRYFSYRSSQWDVSGSLLFGWQSIGKVWVFPEIGVPPFHHKPSILGYQYIWKHPYVYPEFQSFSCPLYRWFDVVCVLAFLSVASNLLWPPL